MDSNFPNSHDEKYKNKQKRPNCSLTVASLRSKEQHKNSILNRAFSNVKDKLWRLKLLMEYDANVDQRAGLCNGSVSLKVVYTKPLLVQIL